MAASPLTAERVRQILQYDPETGVFTRRISRYRHCLGTPTGRSDPNGYIRIKIEGREYSAHRLAWLYMHGEWPLETIDHADGDRTNNAFHNLRAASYAENNANRGIQSTNTCGVKGVRWESGRWRADISALGKSRSLGRFDTIQAARAAYCRAATLAYGEFTHPEDRTGTDRQNDD